MQKVGEEVKLDRKLARLLKGHPSTPCPQAVLPEKVKHLIGIEYADYYCGECHRHIGLFAFDSQKKLEKKCPHCEKMTTLRGEKRSGCT